MLAIGVLVSILCKGRAEAQTTAILLWFGFVLAYDLLLMGSLSIIRLPASSLGFLLVANPIDAARTLTILALDPELYMLGPAGAYLTETFGGAITAFVLVIALLAWTVIPLYVGIRRFAIPRNAARMSTINDRSHTNGMIPGIAGGITHPFLQSTNLDR